MNENKRILLLALGIMAIIASDPPVASYFERPQSVCSIVADLAVGAFDSLVRSTLPLPSTVPEFEQSDEVLVADDAISPRRAGDPPGSDRRARKVTEQNPSQGEVVVRTSDRLVTKSAVPVLVRSSCSGSDGAPVQVLRVEAVMEVSASPIGHS